MTKLIMVGIRENPHRRHYIIQLSIIYHLSRGVGGRNKSTLYYTILLLYMAVYILCIILLYFIIPPDCVSRVFFLIIINPRGRRMMAEG